MVDSTEIILYTQEWSVYLQHFYVNYEKSTSKRECSWTFLHWLKRSYWSFRARVASHSPFLWNLKCLIKYFVSFKKYKWSPSFNLKKSFDSSFWSKKKYLIPPIFRSPPGKNDTSLIWHHCDVRHQNCQTFMIEVNSLLLRTKFYASMIKNKRVRRVADPRPPPPSPATFLKLR